jgi:glycosyltransferase involved in cell wall biosynthesis
MTIHSCKALTFKPYPEFKLGIPRKMKPPALDIVHTHGPFSLGWYGLHVAKKQKIPRVSTFHTLISEYVHYLAPKGRRILKKIAWNYCYFHYKRYDKLIAPSETLMEKLPRRIKAPVVVIPTGIDLDVFKPVAKRKAREKLNIDAEKVYLHVGRLGDEKSIDVLIKAAPDFLDKESQLLIVGKGPATEKLQRSAKEIDGIKFTGFVPDKDLPLYYSAADAFLTASTTETQGIVAAEAMACGCPVIAANAMALAEIVDDRKNGFLFQAGNSKQLARIIRSTEMTKEMQKNAMETAKEYSQEKCVDKLEELYQSLIKH